MSISGLDHINITTTKLEETKAFYMQILGLSEGYRPEFPVPGFWLYLGDEPVIHLMDVGETKTGSADCALDHVAFRTDDYEQIISILETENIEHMKRETPDGAVRQVFFADPNGVTVEVGYRAA